MEEEWKRLSEKEFQIMTYMWEENHPLTMNEIREKIVEVSCKYFDIPIY